MGYPVSKIETLCHCVDLLELIITLCLLSIFLVQQVRKELKCAIFLLRADSSFGIGEKGKA